MKVALNGEAKETLGGIKLHNLDQVLLKGVKNVCLVTEIVRSENIEKTIRQLKKFQGDY